MAKRGWIIGNIPRRSDRMSAEENKTVLLTLYNAVVERDFDAVGELLHEDFIEHNPGVPHEPTRHTGREAFINYFRKGGTPLDGAAVDIKRIIADDDHVMVHYKLVSDRYPRGMAVIDLSRIFDGRFAEHWDVPQEIPQTSANPHKML